MFACVLIQHELGQGTVQTRYFAVHNSETRACNLGSGGEIQSTQGFPQIHMIFGFEVEVRNLSPGSFFAIIFFILTIGHGLIRQIRQASLVQYEMSLNVGRISSMR